MVASGSTATARVSCESGEVWRNGEYFTISSGEKKWVRRVKGEGVFSPLRIEGELLFAYSAGHHLAPMLYGHGARGSKRLWQEPKAPDYVLNFLKQHLKPS